MIFGIGLSKTGTTSLNRALCMLGTESVHYPDRDLMLDGHYAEALEGYAGATDITVSMCFRELDEAFPGSRFILTLRDRVDWLDSMRRHLARRTLDGSSRAGEVRMRTYNLIEFDEPALASAFDAHHDRVRAHFARRPDDLLEMHLCDGEGWERLCPFLGLPIPDEPFPVLNVRKPRPAVA